MRFYRNAVILVVILGLLVGGYVILKNRNSSSTEAADSSTTSGDTTTYKVLKLDYEKITGLTVENRTGKYEFVKVGENWTYPAAEKGFKLSTSQVETMANNISDMDSDNLVEKNVSDLAKYGLDKPMTISAKVKDSKEIVLLIGNQTPTKEGYYVKLKDDSKVYVVGSYVGEFFDFKKDDIRDTALFTSNVDELFSISLQRKGQTGFTAKKDENGKWSLVTPVDAEMGAEVSEKILDGITKTIVVNFVENNVSDLAKYGLKDPQYVLEVETASSRTKILIGKEDRGNGLMYAMLADSKDVFTIDSSNYGFLDKPINEIITPLVALVDINNVSKVVVEMDGKTTTCEVKSDKNNVGSDTFTVNGKKANGMNERGSEIFKDYYQSLIGVEFDQIEMGANPTAKPEITFTYTVKVAPGTIKIEFVPKDNNYYYVMKNGKYSGFLVLKSEFDKEGGLRDMYKVLMDSIK